MAVLLVVLWGPMGTSKGVGLGHCWDPHQEQAGSPQQGAVGWPLGRAEGEGLGGTAGQWQQRTGRRPPAGGAARRRVRPGEPAVTGSRASSGPLLTAQPDSAVPELGRQSRARRSSEDGLDFTRRGTPERHRASVSVPGVSPCAPSVCEAGVLRGWPPGTPGFGVQGSGAGPHRGVAGPEPPVLLVLAVCSPAQERVGGGQEVRARSPLCEPQSPRGWQTPYPLLGGSEAQALRSRCSGSASHPGAAPGAAGPGGTELRPPTPPGCSTLIIQDQSPGLQRQTPCAGGWESDSRLRPGLPGGLSPWAAALSSPCPHVAVSSQCPPPRPVKTPVRLRFTLVASLQTRSPHGHVRKSWGELWGHGPATAATLQGPGTPWLELLLCLASGHCLGKHLSWLLLATFV